MKSEFSFQNVDINQKNKECLFSSISSSNSNILLTIVFLPLLECSKVNPSSEELMAMLASEGIQ